MKLKFIADVHISPYTISSLQKKGYQITRITEYLPSTASDVEIIEFAIQHSAVIITQDLDFSALISQSGLSQPSVVSLRIGNVKPEVVTQKLQQVLPQIEPELAAGAIVSVEENRFRIRKLPVIS